MAKPKKKAEIYLTAESQKALADRLARAEGHLRSVRQMVVDHRCADEILLQLAAVKAAINKTAAVILETEIRACADSCMKGSAEDRMDRVVNALTTILKSS